MEMGQRNLVTFIVLPTIFLLELYAAVLRSYALFHVYKDKKGRRAYKIYNFKAKSQLYNAGKKKGFSYAFPKLSAKKVGGRFYNIYAINEEKYRKKKMDSLVRTEVDKKDEIHPIYEERNKAFVATYYLTKEILPKLRQTEYVRFLNSMGITITPKMLADFIKKCGITQGNTALLPLPREINNNKMGKLRENQGTKDDEEELTPEIEA